MIALKFINIKWGTIEVPDFPNARTLSILDDESGIQADVTFSEEPLKTLVLEMAQGLTTEQRLAVIEELREPAEPGTLVLPGNNDVPKEEG